MKSVDEFRQYVIGPLADFSKSIIMKDTNDFEGRNYMVEKYIKVCK